MKKRINVAGAVLLRDGKVFAARRGLEKSLGGFWEFPGGKIEEGETPEVALHRELQEELIINASVGDFVTTTEHEYDFGIVVLSTYFCELNDGAPTLTEHCESAWLAPEELSTVQWAPADIPAVEIISKKLSA